jgi:hypothetical protein
MFIKYLVKQGESAIVVKFDLRSDKIIMGGYVMNVDILQRLMRRPYFEKSVSSKNCHSQRNKIKYIGRISLDKFLEVMDRVSEDYTVEKVRRVNRLI